MLLDFQTGQSSSLYPINVGVRQEATLASTLCLLNINDLLSSSSNAIHSYAKDTILHCNLQLSKPPSNLDLDHNQHSVHFEVSKTQSCSLFNKRSHNADPVMILSLSIRYFSILPELRSNAIYAGVNVSRLCDYCSPKASISFCDGQYLSS